MALAPKLPSNPTQPNLRRGIEYCESQLSTARWALLTKTLFSFASALFRQNAVPIVIKAKSALTWLSAASSEMRNRCVILASFPGAF